MKTLRLEVEDAYYEQLMDWIRQLPRESVRVQDETPSQRRAELTSDEAADYVLKKNAELYRRLA